MTRTTTENATLASLHRYPVKGMRADDLEAAEVEPRGLEGDRRWMVVDPAGRFFTQRENAALATITPRLSAAGLVLSAPGFDDCRVERPDGSRRMRVTVWKDEVDAAAGGGEADAWLERVLGRPATLAYMDDEARRHADPAWAQRAAPVSFADGFPLLVTTTASLAALNRAIADGGGEPVPMGRFRPNLVIGCEEPWAEDGWRRLRIGEVELELVKPCTRCIVTTTDQETGARRGPEPLATLRRLRRSEDPRVKGLLFGVNAVPARLGRVRPGDVVEILA